MNDEEEVYIPPELEIDDEIPTELPSTIKEPEPVEYKMPESAEPVPQSPEAHIPEEDQQGNQALFVDQAGEATFVAPEHVEAANQAGMIPAMFHVDPKQVDPVSGQPARVAVKKPDFEQAKQAGLIPVYTWHAQRQASEAKKTIPTSGWDAGVRGVASMASLGQTANIAGGVEALRDFLNTYEAKRIPGKFAAGRDVYRLQESAAKEQYPGAYFGGEAAGFAASLPLGVGKTLAQSVLRSGATGGIAAAGGGSDYLEPGSEQMSTEKRALLGTALGAGLGVGGYKLGQAVGRKLAPKLEEVARSRAVKSVQPTISQKFARVVDRLPGGEQELGRDALRYGLIKGGDTVDDIASKAKDLKQRAGEKISFILSQLDTSASGLGAGSASLQNILKRVDDEVLSPLNSRMAKKDLAVKVENAFVKHLRERAQSGEKIGFKELHAERADLDDLAYTTTGIDKVLNKELQKIRKIFEDEIFKGADRVVALGGPKLKTDYLNAKRAYQVGATIAEGAREKAQKFRANRSISLTDYITGGGIGGTAGTTAGALLAGPGGAAVGGAIGAGTGALANKWAREMGNPYLANIAQEFAQKFKGDPNVLQKVLAEMQRLGMIKFSEQGE